MKGNFKDLTEEMLNFINTKRCYYNFFVLNFIKELSFLFIFVVCLFVWFFLLDLYLYGLIKKKMAHSKNNGRFVSLQLKITRKKKLRLGFLDLFVLINLRLLRLKM